MAQDLIHYLKYKGKQEIGEWLGKWLGSYIATVAPFSSTEVVLPVPPRPRKLRRRGYNQVARLGQSLTRTMQIAYIDDLPIKADAVGTQTRKFVWKRSNENDYIFALRNPERWIGKHLLLVGDVITTGSTLECCYTVLSSIPEVKVGVASVVCAVIKQGKVTNCKLINNLNKYRMKNILKLMAVAFAMFAFSTNATAATVRTVDTNQSVVLDQGDNANVKVEKADQDDDKKECKKDGKKSCYEKDAKEDKKCCDRNAGKKSCYKKDGKKSCCKKGGENLADKDAK